MAGTSKRLRRKTTVTQTNCEQWLVLKLSWWIPFLLPPDLKTMNLTSGANSTWDNSYSTWDWAKHLRLLSKCFREAWNALFHVIIHLRTPVLPVLQSILPSERLIFYRLKDPDFSLLRYDLATMSYRWSKRQHLAYWYYMATMPWHSFKLYMSKRWLETELGNDNKIHYGPERDLHRIKKGSIIFQDVVFHTFSPEEWCKRYGLKPIHTSN